MFMFSAKHRPPSTSFQHEDRCRTSDAESEWIDEGHGLWIRTCTCTTEYWHALPEPEQRLKITPDMHRHEPACDATAKVVVDEPTGERYSRCWACMTSTRYLGVRHMNAEELRDYTTGLLR